MCTQAWQEKEIKKLKGLFTDLAFYLLCKYES